MNNNLFVYKLDGTELKYVIETNQTQEQKSPENERILFDPYLDSLNKFLAKETLALKALNDWKNISEVKFHLC